MEMKIRFLMSFFYFRNFVNEEFSKGICFMKHKNKEVELPLEKFSVYVYNGSLVTVIVVKNSSLSKFLSSFLLRDYFQRH